jgi:predicted peptidase
VAVEKSRDMVAALKDAGGKPKYDEYPGVGHNSWDKAYANKELFDWLFMQQKK